MIISNELNLLLFLASMIMLVWMSFTSTRGYLFLCGFLIPLWTPRLNVGVNVFLFQAVPLLTLALLPLGKHRPRVDLRQDPLRKFLIYASVVTVMWWLLEMTVLHRSHWLAALGLEAAQSQYRMPIALVSFLLQCACFYIIPLRARSQSDVIWGLKGFITSCAMSFVIGVAMFFATGVGYVRESEAIWSIDGVSVGRIGGLSGEPRHLGSYVLVALALLIPMVWGRSQNSLRKLSRSPLAWVFVLILAMFATFSTSAWVGFILMVAAFGLYLRRIGAVFVFVVVSTLVFGGLWQSTFFRAAVELRITQRLYTEETQDVDKQKDYIVVAVYEENPHILPLGYGLGGFDLEAARYVVMDKEFKVHTKYVRTPTPSTTAPRLLGELGLIGLLLLGGVALKLSRLMRAKGFHTLAAGVFIVFVGVLPTTASALPAVLFVFGAAWTLSFSRGQGDAASPQSPRRTT